jgi:1D-myo-inositol-tetrakisphosphate 5-kinase/inositol-polyphosphate multikinase
MEPDPAETEELDEDADEEEEPNTHAVKLIDFAHAEFVPGAGSDENVLHGVRSTVKLLEELEAELKAELEA